MRTIEHLKKITIVIEAFKLTDVICSFVLVKKGGKFKNRTMGLKIKYTDNPPITRVYIYPVFYGIVLYYADVTHN